MCEIHQRCHPRGESKTAFLQGKMRICKPEAVTGAMYSTTSPSHPLVPILIPLPSSSSPPNPLVPILVPLPSFLISSLFPIFPLPSPPSFPLLSLVPPILLLLPPLPLCLPSSSLPSLPLPQVFKDGRPTTREKAEKKRLYLVSPLWVEA